jgi:hypothetical protein
MDIARNITVSSFDIPYCCSGVKHHSPQTVGVWNDADASELCSRTYKRCTITPTRADLRLRQSSSKRRAYDVSAKRLALIIGDFCGTLR